MFSHSMVALITPFTAAGEIDWSCLADLIEWHIAEGTQGLVVMGTTGEAASCSLGEKQQAIRFVVDQTRHRLPVVAGTAAVSTKATIELTLMAKSAGADACLIMSPPYVKPSQEGLYQPHAVVANAVALPQLLYNVPGRTAVSYDADTVARLAVLDHIVGIKEASADMALLTAIIAKTPEDFAILSGDDGSALASMLLGASGVISVTANLVPKTMAELCEAVHAHDLPLARRLNQQLFALHQNLFLQSNPIPVKWALAQLGFGNGELRLPLTALESRYHAEVVAAMQQAKIATDLRTIEG